MANELFDIDPTMDTKWWSNIKAKITWLQARDPPFLPTPKPKPNEKASQAPIAKRRRLHDCKDLSNKTATRSSAGESDIEDPISPQSSIMRPQSEWVSSSLLRYLNAFRTNVCT